MPYRNLFIFKDLNMKTLLKKVKTSKLSTGIICSSPQSHETIPLIHWQASHKGVPVVNRDLSLANFKTYAPLIAWSMHINTTSNKENNPNIFVCFLKADKNKPMTPTSSVVRQ